MLLQSNIKDVICRSQVFSLTSACFMNIINWQKSINTGFYLVSHVVSLDWKDYGVEAIIDTVCHHKHLGNGSIILCHNGAKYTAQALDMMIAKLKEQGYTFVPLSELIYREDYEMDYEGSQILQRVTDINKNESYM